MKTCHYCGGTGATKEYGQVVVGGCWSCDGEGLLPETAAEWDGEEDEAGRADETGDTSHA